MIAADAGPQVATLCERLLDEHEVRERLEGCGLRVASAGELPKRRDLTFWYVLPDEIRERIHRLGKPEFNLLRVVRGRVAVTCDLVNLKAGATLQPYVLREGGAAACIYSAPGTRGYHLLPRGIYVLDDARFPPLPPTPRSA